MTASELLFNRRPGSVVFPSGDQQLSAIEAHIARDMKRSRPGTPSTRSPPGRPPRRPPRASTSRLRSD
jgi:hypothetical protein